MAGGSLQRAGAEFFTAPQQLNQRRYEALRAFFVDGLTHAQAAERFGYTRWTMVDLVHDYRAGKLELFARPRKPGPPPGVAPAKDRARGRVIELRRQGLSTYEISAQLAREATPLNRTSVAEILSEEGFGRLLRHPAELVSTAVATPGRDTRLPRTAVLDFTTWPARCDSAKAGLLLLIPDLVALDLPALINRAGYPSTRVVPAASWLLSLLALKLTRTRRVSHVDDLLLTDPAAALLAGLATLPKKTALTDYSYRTSHDHQRAFLAALDQKMIAGGLATADEAIFDLDFHAVMHWGTDPALEKHYVPTRSQRARSVLTFFAQDCGTHNLVYANADISKATQNREVITFCDHWKTASGHDPHMLVMDQKVTTQPVLAELDRRGIKFLTLRMRSPALVRHINTLAPADYKTITLDRPGRYNRPRVHESTVRGVSEKMHQLGFEIPNHWRGLTGDLVVVRVGWQPALGGRLACLLGGRLGWPHLVPGVRRRGSRSRSPRAGARCCSALGADPVRPRVHQRHRSCPGVGTRP
jgi:transposase